MGLIEVLNQIAIDKLLGFLEVDERELLRRSCLFQIPGPVGVLDFLHPQYNSQPELAKASTLRLFGLGLWNRFENPLNHRLGHDHALVDPLVRPKLGTPAMTEAETRRWAGVVCRPLFAAWGGEHERRPVTLDAELTRLGLLAADAGVVAACALNPVTLARNVHDYRAAARLGRACLDLLDAAHHPVPFHLLRHTGLACQVIGDSDRAADLLRRTVTATEGDDSIEAAQALAEYAELLGRRGEIDRAET